MAEKFTKIYTRGGDKGRTSLVGGFRVPKTHPRIEAYGTIDELNSFLGLLMTEIEGQQANELLLYVQSKLFTVGSYLATDPSKMECKIESHIAENDIKKLEDAIDALMAELPPMKSFVLPGGCRPAALAHVCRTICRRAERSIYHLTEQAEVEKNVLAFINRLSDYLFVMARMECVMKNGEEIFWNNTCK